MNKERSQITSKAWRKANREKVNSCKRAWYHRHKQSILRKQAEYYHENREFRLAYAKEYALRHKSEKAIYDKARASSMTPQQIERRRISRLEYARRNPEKTHKWQKEHPELARVVKRKWSQAHPEVNKTWRANNRDKCRAYGRKYAANNPEKNHAWSVRNPELHRECQRKWRQNNAGKVNERSSRRRAKCNQSDGTAEAFYAYVRSKKSVRCYYCGKRVSGKKAHIDHIIAINRDGNHASENLCASCPKCNLRKGTKLPSELKHIPQPLLNL